MFGGHARGGVGVALVIAVVTMVALTSCGQQPDASSDGSSEQSVRMSSVLSVPTIPVSAPAISGIPTAAPSAADAPVIDAPVSDAPLIDASPIDAVLADAAPLIDATPIDAALAAAAPMSSSRPSRLQIPAIGADSALLDLGLQADGTLEVPPDATSIGWFTGGPTPGELGPAVIVGHVDWAGEQGIFYDLRSLQPGDEIIVSRDDGSIAKFAVRSNEKFPKTEFPTGAVYGNIDHAGLRLITCGGSFDPSVRSYEDNIVVFADLVETTAG